MDFLINDKELIWLLLSAFSLAVYFKVGIFVNYKKVSPEYLERLRSKNGNEKYKRALKKLTGELEAWIIIKAERGESRDTSLEEKLDLVKKEKERLGMWS